MALQASNIQTKKALKNTLGAWFFDKKHRKRKYISLTGKVVSGAEAIRISRSDVYNETHPAQLLRQELFYSCSFVTTAQTLTDLYNAYLCLSMVEDTESHLNDGPFEKSPDLLGLNVASNDNIVNPLLLLDKWGIPDSILRRYAVNRITTLFPWQVECLLINDGKVLNGEKNLIYSAPTSGGKTLVAEIFMLRMLSRTLIIGDPKKKVEMQRKTIFFVVPFIALAEEKVTHFREIWQDMNIGVKGFHQEDGSGNALGEDVEVAVCTIERANILFTQLLDEKREDQLSMIVIDEIHMLSDSHRGFLLEVLLSKVKYVLGAKVQIIGMSATLPKIDDLANWLDASLYKTDYRPVNLKCVVCMNGGLFEYGPSDKAVEIDSFNKIESIPYDLDDVDCLKRLCIQTIRENKSVLVFCPKKSSCETSSKSIAEILERIEISSFNTLNQSHREENERNVKNPVTTNTASTNFTSARVHLTASSSILQGNSIAAHRHMILEQLSQTQVGLCPILRKTIPFGIAYHHSGLTHDERKIIEVGFRKGAIQVLCATSTLSAGVNLPAHRVIIRGMKMGSNYLSVASFRQMCGRAGRMGFDSLGEAILLLGNNSSAKDKDICKNLLSGDLEPLQSSLNEGYGGGLEKLLLEMITCGRLRNNSEIMRFIECTLMYTQSSSETDLFQTVKKSVHFLREHQFVQNTSDGSLSPSPFGKATTLSGIAPKDAVEILKSLRQARMKLILKGGLHPVFLVTPPSTHIDPEWAEYASWLDILFKRLPEAQAVAEYLGITMAKASSFRFTRPSLNSDDARLYKRFYSAVILFILIQEWPLSSVFNTMMQNITRGQIQQLQSEASTFCGMTVVFCEKLNWHTLAAVLDDYCGRLNFGVKKELLLLVRIGMEITTTRARKFFEEGITNAEELISAGEEKITDIIVSSLPSYSSAVVNYGKALPQQQKLATSDMDQMLESSRRLAKVIIRRAECYLQEEIRNNIML